MPATDADAAHVRRAFEVFNERFETLRGGALRPYFEEFFTDDLVIDNAEGFPVPATYEGFAGYRSWFDETYGPYTDVRWIVESVTPVGDAVVASAITTGRPHGDSTLLEVRLGLLYRLRDGQVSRIEVYLTPENALAAAT